MQSTKIDLTWSGATDDQGISGYELRYTLGPNFPDNAWVSIPFISSTGSTGSYTHTITSFVDHKFSIRTRDTGSQYSDYQYLTVPLSPQTLISDGYVSSTGICRKISTYPIKLEPDMVPSYSRSSMYVKKIDGSVFDGDNKYWRIAYTNKESMVTTYHFCKISDLGQLIEISACSEEQIIKTVTISIYKSNTISEICTSGAAVEKELNYNGILDIGSLLYSTYIGGILSNLYDGNNKFHILINGSSSYVVNIGTGNDIGKILSIALYSDACRVIIGGGYEDGDNSSVQR